MMSAEDFSTRHLPDGGTEGVVTGRWSVHARKAVESGEVDRLVLNYALGFEELDLEFLRGLPLRQLVILDRRLSNLDPVYSLAPTLELLHLTTGPSLVVDVSRLPELRDLDVDWPQVQNSVGAATRLRRIHLRNYAEEDLRCLHSLHELSELIMKDRPGLRSFAGLSALKSLRRIGVYQAKNLEDLSELTGRDYIDELQLEACSRISEVGELASCTNLRMLNLGDCGELASVGPLRELLKIEVLYLFGTTKIADEDLTPIAGLPRLRELRMQDRRTYRPRVADIQSTLPKA